MFIAVILGYVLVAVFALCGVVSCADYCLERTPGDAGQFLAGLVTAAMPLLYAAALMLLIQIATLLERLSIQSEISMIKSAAPKTTGKTKKQREHGTVYVPKSATHREEAPQQYFVAHETPAPRQEPEPIAPSPTQYNDQYRQFFKTN